MFAELYFTLCAHDAQLMSKNCVAHGDLARVQVRTVEQRPRTLRLPPEAMRYSELLGSVCTTMRWAQQGAVMEKDQILVVW